MDRKSMLILLHEGKFNAGEIVLGKWADIIAVLEIARNAGFEFNEGTVHHSFEIESNADEISLVIDYGSRSCAFCEITASCETTARCLDCMIYRYVYKENCDGTPYKIFHNVIKDGDIDGAIYYARKEFKFLKEVIKHSKKR